MAKHRSRAEKQRTLERRSQVKAPITVQREERMISPQKKQLELSKVKMANYPLAEAMERTKEPRPIPPEKRSLLRVDSRYLMRDIRKSVFVSLVLIVILIGIYWWVRYNGF